MNAVPGGAVYFLVPEGVDDPLRVSGGNVFDRRVAAGLSAIGWDVREIVAGSAESVMQALADVPDGAIALIDGLVAGRASAAIEGSAERLRIVVLAHMISAAFPEADPHLIEGEHRALRAAARVIVTSSWTRDELVGRELIPPEQITIALPGADRAEVGAGTRGGCALLCVGVVAPHKGQDILIEALAGLRATPTWRCTIVGSAAADPTFAAQLAERVDDLGIADRITMAGVLGASDLDAAYRGTDLLVAPSRTESYGMAIADALGRGIPVVASRVGGIPLTVAPGRSAVLVPPEPWALSRALDRWMLDAGLRTRLKDEALAARDSLPRWSDTVERVAETLGGLR
ncbi:glycosyltransferase family 4 protein [Microbacterium rhizomatis]|uniref:Glycosyltransferase family 4 protein n=1 Tax=Microbacterium rhizomatis TaxID=1631477 RepID=A0A5J5J3L3_9MICO|nr:glycosyltransferase family 4 protein [Microbacterium rhizomatis]KAA9107808.1 glycosyltransferase family 4 protein [Microbacterium rhizomatis]